MACRRRGPVDIPGDDRMRRGKDVTRITDGGPLRAPSALFQEMSGLDAMFWQRVAQLRDIHKDDHLRVPHVASDFTPLICLVASLLVAAFGGQQIIDLGAHKHVAVKHQESFFYAR